MSASTVRAAQPFIIICTWIQRVNTREPSFDVLNLGNKETETGAFIFLKKVVDSNGDKS